MARWGSNCRRMLRNGRGQSASRPKIPVASNQFVPNSELLLHSKTYFPYIDRPLNLDDRWLHIRGDSALSSIARSRPAGLFTLSIVASVVLLGPAQAQFIWNG